MQTHRIKALENRINTLNGQLEAILRMIAEEKKDEDPSPYNILYRNTSEWFARKAE